jgi:uncharacterized protein
MSELHRIGVISDTHIPSRARRVPDTALKYFEDVELILHAGDLSILAVVDQLSAYAPVEAVQGNVELPEVIATLPIKREIVVGGIGIGLIHNLGERKRYVRNALREFPPFKSAPDQENDGGNISRLSPALSSVQTRVVVFGHSHVPHIEEGPGLLLLNPGSATDRRRQPVCTIARLIIEDGAPHAEIIPLR